MEEWYEDKVKRFIEEGDDSIKELEKGDHYPNGNPNLEYLCLLESGENAILRFLDKYWYMFHPRGIKRIYTKVIKWRLIKW